MLQSGSNRKEREREGGRERVEINSGVEADKAARDFTASTASAHGLSTSKVTLPDINNDLPVLDRLLKHKRRLRKLWQETRDPKSKTAVNWVAKSVRRMTRKKALEGCETKIGNSEVTPQARWSIAESLVKRDGPKATTAIHGPSRLKFGTLNAVADCLENQFTLHDVCDKHDGRRVEARVQAPWKL
jgi:hypothetical protein